jgi:hypothetical protein
LETHRFLRKRENHANTAGICKSIEDFAMQARLLVTRSGEQDDTLLTIRVERNDSAFSTDVYVNELNFQREIDSFSKFLGNALVQGEERQFNLVIGHNADGSPRAIVCGEVLKSGKVRMRVELWALVQGAQSGILDHCRMHFATDIASLDAFDLDMHSITRGDINTAALAGFELWAL